MSPARICAPAAPAGSFAAAVVACLPALRIQALGLTKNGVSAEDLVQDTVVRALGKAHTFDGADIEAWLATILRNGFIQNIRASSHRRVHLSLTNQDPEAPDFGDLVGSVPGSQMDHMVLSDTIRLFDKLPRRMQVCLLDVTLTDKSIESMAADHGCPTGTIKSRIARARARLSVAMTGQQACAA